MNKLFEIRKLHLKAGIEAVYCKGIDGFNPISSLYEIKNELLNMELNKDAVSVYLDSYNTNGDKNRFFSLNFKNSKFELQTLKEVKNEDFYKLLLSKEKNIIKTKR